MERLTAYALAAAYLATVVAANALIVHVGVVPVGIGLMAPAGVYAAGLALTLRDALQDSGDRRWVVGAIVAGAALSFALGAQLAAASGLAFLVSELADFAVYTPLRRRGWAAAMVASNVVGAVVDSALFLWLAFGSLDFLAGQVVGKLEMTLVAVALIAAWRRARGL
jgi:queuosine precursor transporter